MASDMDNILGLLDNLNLDIRGQRYNPSYTARCYCCKAPHDEIIRPLKRCGGCQLVSYCNKDCQVQDRPDHKEFCKTFRVVNGKNVFFTTGSWDVHLENLRRRAFYLSCTVEYEPIFIHPRVCNVCHKSQHNLLTDCKCSQVLYCSNVCANADTYHKARCNDKAKSEKNFSYHMIQKTFAMSLKFALAFRSKCEIGPKRQWLLDLTTLTIHVVSSNPMLDSYYWEVAFLHTPDLRHLEIVFIIPDKKFDISKASNKLDWPLCASCRSKNRTIKYSIHQMWYHEYFSLLEYTEPDAVAVYGISDEMALAGEDSNIHHELSIRNMLDNWYTILVLMDYSEHLVSLGVKTIKACLDVEDIIEPMINEDRGFTEKGINEKYYFTCVRKIPVL